jgi:hypothetical protein
VGFCFLSPARDALLYNRAADQGSCGTFLPVLE